MPAHFAYELLFKLFCYWKESEVVWLGQYWLLNRGVTLGEPLHYLWASSVEWRDSSTASSGLWFSFSCGLAGGHLVVVELVGRQLQKVVQGLSQEIQRGNEITIPNASVLSLLETKERMPLRNDPNMSPRATILFSVPSASTSCQLGGTVNPWVCSERPVELSLRSVNTCGLVT